MMFISQDKPLGRYTIQSYAKGQITVNEIIYKKSLLLTPETLVENCEVHSISDINDETLKPLLAYEPEVFLLGVGDTSLFPSPSQFKILIEHQIGYEVMTLASACYTFNVLSSEERKVVAGFIL